MSGNQYNPHFDLHRQVLAYVYIPIVQRECDIFIRNWNSHRIRDQGKPEIPTGIPDHMYAFPENFGGEHMGSILNTQHLRDGAEVSKILETNIELQMDRGVRDVCTNYLPDPEKLLSLKAIEAYRFFQFFITVNCQFREGIRKCCFVA